MCKIERVIQDRIGVNIKMIGSCIKDIESASEVEYKSNKNGNKIFWYGNGGSASGAQHMAA